MSMEQGHESPTVSVMFEVWVGWAYNTGQGYHLRCDTLQDEAINQNEMYTMAHQKQDEIRTIRMGGVVPYLAQFILGPETRRKINH